jgi:outer membrane protein assembly factor BamA
MIPFRKYWLCFILICLTGTDIFSQNYHLQITPAGKDTSLFSRHDLNIKTSFPSREECTIYINKLPSYLLSKGYPAASVDTVIYDSASARIILYTGQKFQWAEINTDSFESKVLDITGWKPGNNRTGFMQLQELQQKILSYYETNGYPFAAVKLADIRFDGDKINARITADKGPYYVIDSIRIYGKVKIKNIFMQRYLDIENGSAYNKNKLQDIGRRILQLPYLQEQQHWDLNMLGSGSVLNLYLQQKRSSQVNFLVGFLPSSTPAGKLQVTADVNLDLKNSLGSGETILLNWQQLQKQSPRLNLGYQHPFIFRKFGLDFGFDLLKRDSSFLQINGQLGLLYVISANRSAKIFFQNQRTYLLSGGYDTNQVKLTRRLPSNIDVNANSLGLSYEWANTNYLFNPRKGNEIKVITSAGLKRISKNSEIANLKDPAFNFNTLYDSLKLKTYQVRMLLQAAHYFPAGKRSTLKTALTTGLFQSEDIFRNELFRIGGYKILRGFDEESIYASRYAIFTAEYRYLTGLNSFLFLFTDAAVTKTKYQSADLSNNFLSTGLGLSVETGFGILNVSYAIGKRNDVKFDLRGASKIHFGYINYF